MLLFHTHAPTQYVPQKSSGSPSKEAYSSHNQSTIMLVGTPLPCFYPYWHKDHVMLGHIFYCGLFLTTNLGNAQGGEEIL